MNIPEKASPQYVTVSVTGVIRKDLDALLPHVTSVAEQAGQRGGSLPSDAAIIRFAIKYAVEKLVEAPDGSQAD